MSIVERQIFATLPNCVDSKRFDIRCFFFTIIIVCGSDIYIKTPMDYDENNGIIDKLTDDKTIEMIN